MDVSSFSYIIVSLPCYEKDFIFYDVAAAKHHSIGTIGQYSKSI